MSFLRVCLLAVAVLELAWGGPVDAEKLRIGYWASGLGVATGTLLEDGRFVEKEGVEVEYVRFTDVNAPVKALLSNSIDLAYTSPSMAAFSLAGEGVPFKIILATQLAEGRIVVPENSPHTSLAAVRGRKIGTLAVGSSMHGIVATILHKNYGLKTGDYEAVPGSELRLAQYLARGDLDFASLRAVTIDQVEANGVKLRALGDFASEWRKLSGLDAPPSQAVAIVSSDYAARNPDALVKFIVAYRKSVAYGSRNKDAVVRVLRSSANLPAEDAAAFAANWDAVFIADFGPARVEALKHDARVFREVGLLKRPVPESVFAPEYFDKATGARRD